MIKKVLWAGIFLLILTGSCGTTSVKVDPVDTKDYTTFGRMLIANEDAEFLVRVEFVFTESQVTLYPALFTSFQNALQEWAEILPIEGAIFVAKDGEDLVNIRRAHPFIIYVNFASNIYNGDDQENRLGVWINENKMILLDLADLYVADEFMSDMSRGVILHELGHVFGLPHIGNRGSMVIQAGDLVVSSGAQLMLMSPYMPENPADIVISDMEAEYAKAYVKSVLSHKLQNF